MTNPTPGPVAVVQQPEVIAVQTETVVSAPLRSIYMRCTENRVEDDYDGGLVLLKKVLGQTNNDLVDAALSLVFHHDGPMMEFPTDRGAKQDEFFRIDVYRVPFSEVPPNPDEQPLPTAVDMVSTAIRMAEQEGNTALADALRAQVP